MKQIHIVQSIAADFGGLGLAALRYSQALSNAGENISLYVIDRSKMELNIDPNNGLINLHGGGGDNAFTRIISLINFLKINDYDILHIHGTWTPLLSIAGYIAIKMKRLVIISPHGCLEPWALKHRKWKKRIALFLYQKKLFDKSSMLVATAKQELESIRHLGIKVPVAVIPNGVDIPIAVSNIKHSTKTILFLSRIHPKKGLSNLVEAWARVRRVGWSLIIAGQDECGHVKELTSRINILGLNADFYFPGLVIGNEKEKLFSQASIFILPTHSENFGIAVAESLARGVPVITTTGAPWEDILKWDCGWWVSPDVDGLSRALVLAMNTPQEELRKMGMRGKKLVNEKYSWDQIGFTATNACEWLYNQKLKCPDYINNPLQPN